MFIHVPAAWVASLAYVVMTASALGTLVWRHPLAEAAQKAAAPLGACFTFICLVTGSLWGKPMWGTYWVWTRGSPRCWCCSSPISGSWRCWHTIEEPGRAARAASVLTLVGAVNLPIVKFSVDWWNTLHQGSIFTRTGSTVDASMLVPLLLMAVSFTLTFTTLHLMSIRNEVLRRRLRRLMLAAAADREPAARMVTAEAVMMDGSAYRLHYGRLRRHRSRLDRHGDGDPARQQALQRALDRLDPRRGGPASKPRAAGRPVEPS